MSMRWHDQKSDDYLEHDEDPSLWDKEMDNGSSKNARRQMIRRKLEEKMEMRRIKSEINDYEQELDEGFDWDDYDKK